MEEYDVIIAGAGAAGLTAGIYAAREGLNSVIIEKDLKGGQGIVAPMVANFPGFKSISGLEFIKRLGDQASSHIEIKENEEIKKIQKKDEEIIITTEKTDYRTKSLIICSGAKYRKLGVKGEDKFLGKGVSHCSICDGMFFKDKEVVVVGGGNAAAEHALHLKELCSKVSIIHRRDELRAQKYLQDNIKNAGIPVIWNSVVKEIKGDEVVKSVLIYNRQTDVETEMAVDGIFVAIGEEPNSNLAGQIGVERDEEGYIITDRAQKTNVPHIYAAGDVTGGVKQLVVACGEGAVAAISAYQDLKINK
jgi:thioredoxin reductase (NADPH)